MRSIRKFFRGLRVLRWPLVVSVLIGSYFLGLQLTGNFHTVIPGEFYRSAQVSGVDVELYQKRYGIRTILNLRGENTGRDWYDAEVAASKAAGVEHLDFRMSAKRELTEERARELIAMMQSAQKPLLIHCNAGADRSGLAAALYMLAIAHQPESEAEQQLWPIYGHLSLPFIKEYAMDRSWQKLKGVVVQP